MIVVLMLYRSCSCSGHVCSTRSANRLHLPLAIALFIRQFRQRCASQLSRAMDEQPASPGGFSRAGRTPGEIEVGGTLLLIALYILMT